MTTAAQLPTPTRTATPGSLLTHRPAVTAAVNGAVNHAPITSTTNATALVPRGRATFTASNGTATNGNHADASATRSSVANGLLSLPAPSTKSTSPINVSAPTPSLVQDGSNSAAASSLTTQDVIIRAKIDARRPPQDKAEIGKYYRKHPERKEEFVKARVRIVRKVVQLAAAGDMAAAKDECKHLTPSANWLVEAAFAAWSGAITEHADHPTIMEIVAAIDAEKQRIGKATKVGEGTDDPKHSVVTPATTPAASNAPDTTNSSITVDTKSTAVSSPTPRRTVMGVLTVTCYDAAHRFLGNKEYPLALPVRAHMALMAEAEEFDPFQLATDMEAFARKYSDPAATV